MNNSQPPKFRQNISKCAEYFKKKTKQNILNKTIYIYLKFL